MSADDRDWYRERAAKTMQDHYYDPKVFRGSREVRADQPRITFLQFVIANALPYAFLIVAGAIWQIAHGATPHDALLMTTQWLKGFVLSHPVLCLLMVAGAAFYMARPRLAGIAYVWIGIGFLCFVAFDYFGKKPAATAAQRAGEPPRVATMSVPKNQRGHYETPGSINGQPVTFIVDTGAGVTSVPGSLAKPLGITSCEPRQFSTAAGEVFGCVATVAEVVFGSFRAHNVQVAVMPTMNGPALLGMNILGMVQIEQRGSALLFYTTHFREDD